MSEIKRLLELPKKSFFLFGPRGTGKTTWIKNNIQPQLNIDLLKSTQFLKYKSNPDLLENEVNALKDNSWICIDEIQKIPELLDVVHSIIFEKKKIYNFVLTGSSARKLIANQANLLAGRALTKKMFVFSCLELKSNFNLNTALQFGLLPEVYLETNQQTQLETLDAYVETYLRQEIQQEALVRNLDAFYRFLKIIGIMSGNTLSISNIASEVGIARSTVQGYFQIVYDTLIGWTLPAFRPQAKVKEVQHPKFYLFDVGVQRALSGELRANPSSKEKGHLFEIFLINEIRALNSYHSLGLELFYWGTESENEVDLILVQGKKIIGIEIKSTTTWHKKYNKGLQVLLDKKNIQDAWGLFNGSEKLIMDSVKVFPYQIGLKKLIEFFGNN